MHHRSVRHLAERYIHLLGFFFCWVLLGAVFLTHELCAPYAFIQAHQHWNKTEVKWICVRPMLSLTEKTQPNKKKHSPLIIGKYLLNIRLYVISNFKYFIVKNVLFCFLSCVRTQSVCPKLLFNFIRVNMWHQWRMLISRSIFLNGNSWIGKIENVGYWFSPIYHKYLLTGDVHTCCFIFVSNHLFLCWRGCNQYRRSFL